MASNREVAQGGRIRARFQRRRRIRSFHRSVELGAIWGVGAVLGRFERNRRLEFPRKLVISRLSKNTSSLGATRSQSAPRGPKRRRAQPPKTRFTFSTSRSRTSIISASWTTSHVASSAFSKIALSQRPVQSEQPRLTTNLTVRRNVPLRADTTRPRYWLAVWRDVVRSA